MEWKLDFLWLRGELDILPEAFFTKPGSTVITVTQPSTSAENIDISQHWWSGMKLRVFRTLWGVLAETDGDKVDNYH